MQGQIVGVVASYGTIDSMMPRGPKSCRLRAVAFRHDYAHRTDSVDPATLIESAKRRGLDIDPLQTFYRTATLDELVDRTLITDGSR